MAKTVAFKSMFAAVGALAALTSAGAVQARSSAAAPQVIFVPVAEAPTPPAGMMAVCLNTPSDGAPLSKSCPVISYGGRKTWIYSYADNRVSFGVVTYDATGKVLQSVEKPGARYVFDVYVGARSSTIVLVGQAKASVEMSWSDLPH